MKKKWGSYKVLGKGKDWKVKILRIKPRGFTSRHSHSERAEFWFDKETLILRTIPKRHIHQLQNNSDKEKIVFEIQLGHCVEKDIKRYGSKSINHNNS